MGIYANYGKSNYAKNNEKDLRLSPATMWHCSVDSKEGKKKLPKSVTFLPKNLKR